MRNAGKRRQAMRCGARSLGAALALISAAFALTPAGAAQPSRPAGLARPGVFARPSMLFPGSSKLQDVYCTSSSSCLAVGFLAAKSGALINEIVRWDGHQWSKVSVPDPAGRKAGADNELFGVRCTSAADCWAVGFYLSSKGGFAQALHWNGRRWALTLVPEPGGTGIGDSTGLSDVSCTSARNCWAVGRYDHDSISSERSFNLTLHWNGTKWVKVTAANPAGTSAGDTNSLDTVRCASPSDCWAAGSTGLDTGPVSLSLNEMLHWNGTKWSAANVPSPGGSMLGNISELNGLSCTSAKDCWAVGSYDSNTGTTTLNQVLHWNGQHWSMVATANPDGTATGDDNFLNSVNCSAADNCWAVGSLGDVNSGGTQTGEALHWQGATWKLAATPNPAGTTDEALNSLDSVRCVSAKDCWIVGFSQVSGDPDISMFLHWNSKKWSVG